MLIDTRCRLTLLSDAGNDVYSIIHNAKEVEVNCIVDISVGTDDFMRRRALVKEVAERSRMSISMTAGVSPFYAGRRVSGDVDLVKRQALGEKKVVAIGEIRGIPFERLAEETTRNSRAVAGVDVPDSGAG
jgi:Tat protein secretion system quality control protein TatD with DNase activity